MGILQNILPVTSGIIAGNSQAAQSARPAQNGAENAALQNALQNGQAVVVSLSSSNPKRIASHGESRRVDASFEKQEVKKDAEKKTEGDKKKTQGAVDVSA